VEDDPDRPGSRRFAFSAVEGFVPPAAVEMATTTVTDDPPETPTE